jgi:short subunit dehydrogenase-like uncharacterized protein
MSRYLRPLFTLSPVREFFKRSIQSRPAGPTDEERATARGLVWGEATDAQGRKAVARLEGPEPGYTWTLITALDAMEKVLAGNVAVGFQTPAQAFGSDFILQCKDVQREDVI